MMIDHIVAHFDTAREISDLKASLDAAGIPFEPSWGKKAKGFEISNIWIGEQYFELVQIKDDNNLWQPEWATRHRAGDRGAYCLFLDVDEEIETLRARLIGAGIAAGEVQRTSFKWFFNLFEKRLPWRFLLTPPLPGSPIEIGFIQYDPGAREKHGPFMVPNSRDMGLLGLSEAVIFSDDPGAAETALGKLTDVLGTALPLRIAPQDGQSCRLKLLADWATDAAQADFQVLDSEITRG
ncbi:MAG: VOC family protein [Maritimibacter sp.]